VTLTTDLHGRWTKEWIRWGGLEKLWLTVFDWLIPAKDPFPLHEVRINPVGNRPVLDLYLYRKKDDTGPFRYSLTGKGAKGKGNLKRVAPGHYRTTLPFSAPGDYRIKLSDSGPKKHRSFPLLGYSVPFDPRAEVPRDSFNIDLLERLARSTGGMINPEAGEEIMPLKVIRTSIPLRSYLILSALILFLLEIIYRRFILRHV
jgi:hypothetical protein